MLNEHASDAGTIRAATPVDIPAIARIYAHAVETGTASYEIEAPDGHEMARRFAALAARGYPYLVAVEKRNIAGFAYAGPFRDRPAYRFMVEDSIYVDPAAQGKGLGRALLGALVEACAALGFRQMAAVIGDGSAGSASIRLHEALGFRHAGSLAGSGYKQGRWLDTVFMQRALNEGTSTPPDPDSLPERLFGKGE